MKYLIASIATRWGNELGGINVFNFGLMHGIEKILQSGAQCICFVENNNSPRHTCNNLEVLEIDLQSQKISEKLDLAIDKIEECAGVLIIGHDIQTGGVGSEVALILRKKHPRLDILSSSISHMSYIEYSAKKGQGIDYVSKKSEQQGEIVGAVDIAFAVGPLLQRAFQGSRKSAKKEPIIRLIPGAAAISPMEPSEEGPLHFFIAGRLSQEDDVIKNATLTIRSIVEAAKSGRTQNAAMWGPRASLFLFGIEPGPNPAFNKLQEDVANDAVLNLQGIPFSSELESQFKTLALCHIAFMPSWHEGFGLTGWEALCAGVPLICSRQSGLALLLQDLKANNPDLPIDSVDFIDISGSNVPGGMRQSDIDLMARTIQELIQNYSQKKASALALSRHLKAEFNWERCAHTLIESTNWYYPGATDWKNRQLSKSKLNESWDAIARDTIERAKDYCQLGQILPEWQTVCSALNIYSDLSRNGLSLVVKRDVSEGLQIIRIALETELNKTSDDSEIIKNSSLHELMWRYLAASAGVAASFGKLATLVPKSLLSHVSKSKFLQKEFLQYLSNKFSIEFKRESRDLAKEHLSIIDRNITEDFGLQVRLARLMSTNLELKSIFTNCESHNQFVEEQERCSIVLSEAPDLSAAIQLDPKIACTSLALSVLHPDNSRQSIDHPLALIKSFTLQFDLLRWRGDKRLPSALLTTTISSRNIEPVLNAFATDEDETIRWAAIDLAFSRPLFERLVKAFQSSRSHASILKSLGSIVDQALLYDGGHPWLYREFLEHYENHRWPTRSEDDGLPKFRLEDFPNARKLLGPTLIKNDLWKHQYHPEVKKHFDKLKRHLYRILLVLPPISSSSNIRHSASRTSTPPLGLGEIATAVSNEGHDVYIADCHRYPELFDKIPTIAASFDLIGCNIVLSTIKSTYELFSNIRSRTPHPTLIVGGPAAKLNSWKYSHQDEKESECWDFSITENEVDNIISIIDQIDGFSSWRIYRGVAANEDSPKIIARDPYYTSTPPKINKRESRAIDRRVYQTSEGQFEPSLTRSSSAGILEAHVFMSQGCDWNCTFCTERFQRSGGEKRRSIDDVKFEISSLVSENIEIGIQFIDDNFLPQLASPIIKADKVREASALAWARDFLKFLEGITFQKSRKQWWRGICRIEDLLAFRSSGAWGDFFEQLKSSGCKMLAFGIECGNELARSKMKAGISHTNSDIIYLIQELRSNGIFTKGYFILGGHNETVESSLETINFAISCGVDIAYFAIYKDFVKAASALSKDRLNKSIEIERFLSYDQFLPPKMDEVTFDMPFNEAAILSELERLALDELMSLGFSFSDLVKYNDFHSLEGSSKEVLESVTWGNPSMYFQMLNYAYRKFYLRPEFVNCYRLLLASGY